MKRIFSSGVLFIFLFSIVCPASPGFAQTTGNQKAKKKKAQQTQSHPKETAKPAPRHPVRPSNSPPPPQRQPVSRPVPLKPSGVLVPRQTNNPPKKRGYLQPPIKETVKPAPRHPVRSSSSPPPFQRQPVSRPVPLKPSGVLVPRQTNNPPEKRGYLQPPILQKPPTFIRHSQNVIYHWVGSSTPHPPVMIHHPEGSSKSRVVYHGQMNNQHQSYHSQQGVPPAIVQKKIIPPQHPQYFGFPGNRPPQVNKANPIPAPNQHVPLPPSTSQSNFHPVLAPPGSQHFAGFPPEPAPHDGNRLVL